MPKLTEATPVVTDVKTLIMLGALLIGMGGVLWQNRQMADEIKQLKAKQTQMNDALVGVVQTLRNNGTIR